MNAPISRGLLHAASPFQRLGVVKVEMNAPISRGLLLGKQTQVIECPYNFGHVEMNAPISRGLLLGSTLSGRTTLPNVEMNAPISRGLLPSSSATTRLASKG